VCHGSALVKVTARKPKDEPDGYFVNRANGLGASRSHLAEDFVHLHDLGFV
jgi:hypothetical protein